MRRSSPTLATPVSAAVATADVWTRDVERLLGRDDPDVAFAALRAVLHALRRRLDDDRADALGASLPTVLRGVFHEPLDAVGRTDTRAEFLACVDRVTRHAVRPEEAVRAVSSVLAARVPPDVWRAVREALPPEVGVLLRVPPYPAASRSRSLP